MVSDTAEVFAGSFTQQEPIPEEAIDAAVAVMRHGRLHRYNTAPCEIAEAALLEQEFAAMVGAHYCLAVASGGYAIATALRAVGVKPGDRVLSNAFTLAPVPGAIAAVGATPIFVDVTQGLVIDLDDLAAKLDQARVLLLSHMRGHICDMDRLMALCDAAGVTVVEDCAHTMGASWNGVLLVTDDAALAARAIMLSGSYMLYDRHLAGPPPETFETLKYDTPNISGRMDNLRAAILRPQLKRLETQIDGWNARYHVVQDGLRDTPGLTLINRPAVERFVGSSFQFLLSGWTPEAIAPVLSRCAARGVELKWFGGAEPVGFTSRYDSWRYAEPSALPASDVVLASIIDMRVPLTFSLDDCALIARIIRAEVSAVFQQG